MIQRGSLDTAAAVVEIHLIKPLTLICLREAQRRLIHIATIVYSKSKVSEFMNPFWYPFVTLFESLISLALMKTLTLFTDGCPKILKDSSDPLSYNIL